MAHHDAVLPAVTMHRYAEGVNSSRPSPEAIFADAAVFESACAMAARGADGWSRVDKML
jgi:hypothetical protein